MIDPNIKLTVLQDNNSTITDHTQDAADFLRDNFTVTLDSGTDYLYIGFDRPFGAVFCEMSTANTNAGTFSAEIYNGTSYVAHSINDETKSFTRSGYIIFDKEDMKKSTVDGKERFYIRLRPSVTHTAVTMQGVNIILADDEMLKQEFTDILNAAILPAGENGHIIKHVSTRNHIIQRLRNKGYIKTDSNGKQVNMTAFDLMDIFELRQSAVYMALSKIFFELSDSPDDQYWAKYLKYNDLFEEAFRLATLTFDNDNDGLTDKNEQGRPVKSVRWNR